MGLVCTAFSAVCMSFFPFERFNRADKSGAMTAFVKFKSTLYLVFDGLPIRYR